MALDERGLIITDDNMKTRSRVYAAGDVRETALRQIITAAANGAIAATAAARLNAGKLKN